MSFSWNYFALTTKNGSYNAIQSSPRTRCYSPVKRHFNKYAFFLVKNNIFFKNNNFLTPQTVAILYLCLFVLYCYVYFWWYCLFVGVRWGATTCIDRSKNSCTSGFYVWFLFCVCTIIMRFDMQLFLVCAVLYILFCLLMIYIGSLFANFMKKVA